MISHLIGSSEFFSALQFEPLSKTTAAEAKVAEGSPSFTFMFQRLMLLQPLRYSKRRAKNGFVPPRPPNTRLKLAAPVLNESQCQLDLRCDRFSFVIISARRRSLSAIR